MAEATPARRSIRGQLLLFLVASLLLMVVGAAIVTYRAAIKVANDAYDRALLDPAIDIAENIRIDAGEARIDLPRKALEALLYDQIDEVVFQVRDEGGRIVGGADDLPSPTRLPVGDERILRDSEYRGVPMRMIAMRTANGFLVQIGETLRKRDRLVRDILVAELVPTVLMAAISIALAWLGVVRGLKPLDRSRQYLLARRPGDLSPVPAADAPVEIGPLVDALNQLLRQLGEARELQQRFLANVAHQLRTPLAGLQMYADLLARRELAPDARADVEHMRRATARAIRIANQLLALARAENLPAGSGTFGVVDLAQVADAAAREWAPKAIALGIDLGFTLEPAPITADAQLIVELLDNLIDNALRYTPRGGTVTVTTDRQRGFSRIAVEDSGPGIPEAEREKVLERFYRIPGAPSDGSGLGLAIVKEIAQRFRGSLEIGTRGEHGGCRVRVAFPESPHVA